MPKICVNNFYINWEFIGMKKFFGLVLIAFGLILVIVGLQTPPDASGAATLILIGGASMTIGLLTTWSAEKPN